MYKRQAVYCAIVPPATSTPKTSLFKAGTDSTLNVLGLELSSAVFIFSNASPSPGEVTSTPDTATKSNWLNPWLEAVVIVGCPVVPSMLSNAEIVFVPPGF